MKELRIVGYPWLSIRQNDEFRNILSLGKEISFSILLVDDEC